jgi:phage protein D
LQGIVNKHPVLQIFGVKHGAFRFKSGGDNQAVSVRELIPVKNTESRKNCLHGDINNVKLFVELPDYCLRILNAQPLA